MDRIASSFYSALRLSFRNSSLASLGAGWQPLRSISRVRNQHRFPGQASTRVFFGNRSRSYLTELRYTEVPAVTQQVLAGIAKSYTPRQEP